MPVDAGTDPEIAYVPALLQRRVAAQGGAYTSPGAEDVEGAVLFADITGFTALTERLAREDVAGTEKLTRLLNRVFGEVVAMIESLGGDVVKFAGDALLAVWTSENTRTGSIDPARAARLAAQCGLAVQKRLHDWDAGEGIRLSLRLAVGAGSLRLVHLGGHGGRWEFLVAGDAVLQIARASAESSPGEVVLSSEAWRLVERYGMGEITRAGYRLRSIADPLAPRALVAPSLGPAEVDALRGFLPGAVTAGLALVRSAQGAGWLAELRRLTVVFVHLPGFDEVVPNGPAPGLDRAQALMTVLQETLARYEGQVNKLSVDDKGVSAVCAFGLPPLAHEDDASRAVRAATRIARQLEQMGIAPAIGVATGRAYCGAVGGEGRREYTMIGDVVNLAARLMQASESQLEILVDGATAQAAGTRVDLVRLPPLPLKGKSEPIDVWAPGDRDERTSETMPALGPIVGRAEERAIVARRLELVRDGTGGVLLIEGEAGIGKSRLLRDGLVRATQMGLRVLFGAADAVEKSTSYYAWRTILGQALGVEGRREPDALREVLDALPQDKQVLAPLLSAILPLDLPDNTLTASMEGPVRAENTHALVVELLTRAEPGPLVVAIEDLHWLDSASWELLRVVARDVPRVLLLAATRPLEAPYPPAYTWLFVAPKSTAKLTRGVDAVQIALGAMSHAEVVELVGRRLGVRSLPEPVETLLREKAEGHPFFAEELALALRDAGLIEIVQGVCRVSGQGGDLLDLSFGNSLEAVITSRIDRLPPAMQLTLKVASVIGRVFAVRILRDVHPVPTPDGELDGQLAELDRLDLTPLETPEPDRSYIFKHVLTQQATYNLMLYAQRRELHRAVAEWYERAHASDLVPYHPLLAYHWGKAEVAERTVFHLERAGENAARTNANHDAVAFFEEAKKTAASIDVSNDRRSAWEGALGNARFGLGHYEQARANAVEAVRLLGWPSSQRPAVQALGIVAELALHAAHRWLPFLFPARADALRRRTASHHYERITEVDYILGRKLPSFYALMRTLTLAESAGACGELVRAYGSMCLGLSVTKNPRLADIYARLARQTDAEIKDPRSRAWMRMLVATHDLAQGRFEAALQGFGESAAQYRKWGDWSRWATNTLPSGWARLWSGDVAGALQLFQEVVQAAPRHENAVYVGMAYGGLAAVALRRGQFQEAVALCEEGLEAIGKPSDPVPELILWGPLALAALRLGQEARARDAIQAGLDIVRRTDPLGCYLVEGYSCLARAAVGLAQAHGDEPTVQQDAKDALAGLLDCSGAFPVSRPRYDLVVAIDAAGKGRRAAASRAFARALREAERLGTRWDVAVIRHERGVRLGVGDDVAKAADELGQLGLDAPTPGSGFGAW